MKQIELEPDAYRVTGRKRLVRSILHKPVFMTISTALGIWCAVPLFLGQVPNWDTLPTWGLWLAFAGWPVAIAFAVLVVVTDVDDRQVEIASPKHRLPQAPSRAAQREAPDVYSQVRRISEVPPASQGSRSQK